MDDLPCQMKILHEKYLEKEFIASDEELANLAKQLKMKPNMILYYFRSFRAMDRDDEKIVIAEDDVPKFKHGPRIDSESETEDAELSEYTPTDHEKLKGFFEKNQYPSDAYLERIMEKTGLSWARIKRVYTSKRQVATSDFNSGKLKELPWQMRKLREELEKSESGPDEKRIEELSKELGIEHTKVEGFFRTQERLRSKDRMSKAKKPLENDIGEARDEQNQAQSARNNVDEMNDDDVDPHREFRRQQNPSPGITPPGESRSRSFRMESSSSQTEEITLYRSRSPRRIQNPSNNTIKTEYTRKLERVVADARVDRLGEEFRNIPLPFNFSIDTRTWDQNQTIDFAEQFLPSEAVEVIRANEIYCDAFHMFTANIGNPKGGMRDFGFLSNPKSALTFEMFVEFGNTLKKIDELREKKMASSGRLAPSTQASSSSSTSSQGMFQTTTLPATRKRPHSEEPVGLPGNRKRDPVMLRRERIAEHGIEFQNLELPFNNSIRMNEWTARDILEVACQILPEEFVETLSGFGITFHNLRGFMEKDEETFEQFSAKDMNIHGTYTFSFEMFRRFGDHMSRIRELFNERKEGENQEESPSPTRNIKEEAIDRDF